jgi:hypothetical protein
LQLRLEKSTSYKAPHYAVFFSPPPFHPSLARMFSPLFSNTRIFSLRSSLNVGHQVSHPYKTTSTWKKCSFVCSNL